MNHILPDLDSPVAVLGGGVAGIWAAYKLIKAGIPTTLITYLDKDRGGIQGSTYRSVGAINTSPLTNDDFASYMDDLGRKCAHPFVTQALQQYLKDEIDELSSLVALKPIKIGLALESESGKSFLQYMYELFESLGGRIINAWVTRLVMDENVCQGLQSSLHLPCLYSLHSCMVGGCFSLSQSLITPSSISRGIPSFSKFCAFTYP